MMSSLSSKFSTWWRPPVFPDEEETRMVGLIMQISGGVVVASAATVIPFILVELTWQNFWATLLGNGLSLIGSLVAMTWARQGRVRQASWMIILILMVAVTLSGLFFGLALFPMPTYILFVAMSGLLLGPRGALHTGVISLLAIVLVLSANIIGLFAPPALPERIAADALTTMILIVLTTWLIYIIVQHLHQVLIRSRQAEAEVRNLNANLEALVAERTGELRRTTRLLQALMDNAPMPVFIKTSSDWRYQLVNRQYQSFYGRTPGEVMRHTDFDFYPPAVANNIRSTDEVVVEHKKPITVEIALPDAEGTQHTLLSTIFPILDDENQVYAVGGISLDITERKQAELDLQLKNEQLTTLHGITLDLLNRENPDDILTSLLNHILHLLDTEHANIDLLENEDEIVTLIASEGQPLQKGDRTRRGEGGALTWQAIDSRQPALVDDYSVWGQRRTSFGDFPYHAVAQIPMIRENKAIGVLSISRTKTNRPFTREDISVAFQLAQIAAMVFDNASLYETARRELLERKQAESALRQSEALYRAIIEASYDGITVVDLAGKAIIANRQAAALFGYDSLEEIIGSDTFKRIPPETLEENLHQYQRLIQERASGTITGYLLKKDGSRFPAETSLGLIADDAGEPGKIVAITRDITERIRVEEEIRLVHAELEMRVAERTSELKSANEFLESMLATSLAINSSLDLDEVLDLILKRVRLLIPCRALNIMLIRGENAFIARRIGYEGLEHIERNLINLQFPLSWPTFEHMIETGRKVIISDTLQADDWRNAKSSEWARSYIGIPLRMGKNTLGFLNASHHTPNFFTDEHVTILDALATQASTAIHNANLLNDLRSALENEKAAQVQLLQSERLALAGRLLATVSHELNNPIQAIQNTLYLLQDETGISQQGREDLSILLAESDRMAALIERLRSIYRPIRSEELFPLQLNELVEDIQLLTAAQFRHKNIKFQSKLDPTLPRITGNPDQLKQVILNLVMNALDATPPGGLITLQTHATENEIEFSIKDTGTGIAPEMLPQIFINAFVTGKNTGTGLGLTIVHDIIKRHHGHAAAVNAPEGGAVFTFSIPTQADSD